MAAKPTKSIRLSAETQRLLRLLAAFEQRTEGDIVEDALAAYLQIRSLSYTGTLPEAAELANTTPDSVGDIVERLTTAIERAIGEGHQAPAPGEARSRLKARVAERTHA